MSAVALSIKLYTEGQTHFLNVLQAQRSLFVTEETSARSIPELCRQSPTIGTEQDIG